MMARYYKIARTFCPRIEVLLLDGHFPDHLDTPTEFVQKCLVESSIARHDKTT